MAQSDDNEAAASPQSSSTRRRRGKSTESSRLGSLTRKDSGKKKKKKSHTSSSGSHKSGKKSSSKTATTATSTAAAAASEEQQQQHNHSGRSRRSRSSRVRSSSKKPSRSLSVSTLNSCNSEELPQAAAAAPPSQANNTFHNLHHSSRSLAVSSDDDDGETILSQTKTKRPLRSALKPSATVSLADSTDSSITGDKGGSSSLMRPQSPTPSPLRVMRRFMAPSSPNSRRGRSKAVVVPASSSSAALPLPDIVVGNKATTTRVRFNDPPATTYIEPESPPLSEHEHRLKYWSKAELRQILQRVQASALQASRNDAKLLLCVHSCYGFAIDKQQQQQVLLAQQQQQQQQQSATDAKTKDDNADDPVKVLLSSPQRALHYYFHCSITEDFTEPPLPSPEAADWAHDLTSSVTTLRGLERHISFAIVDYQMRCIQAVLEAQRLLKQQVRELQQQQDSNDDQTTVEHHQRILETALSRQSTQTSLLARRFARLLGKGDAAIVGAKNGRSVVEKQQQAAAAAAASSSSPKTTTSHKRR